MDVGWCVYPFQNAKKECERNGNVFLSCEEFSVSDCETTPNELIQCFVGYYHTCSKRECEEGGERIGRCDDNDVMVMVVVVVMAVGLK